MAIKKVATLADWEGLAKEKTESTIGLIEDGNQSVVHGVFVEKPLNAPAEGDMVFVDAEKNPHLIAFDTYEASMKPADWTAVGVVSIINAAPHIIYKENKLLNWADAYRWRVAGWKLDNSPHEVAVAMHGSHTCKPDTPITYQGSSIDEVLPQIQNWLDGYNAKCAASGDKYAAQIKYAARKIDDATIELMVEPWCAYWLYSLTLSGLTVTPNFVISGDYNAYKRSNKGGEGGIYNWRRAIEFFEASTYPEEYNGAVLKPISNISARPYPIHLTAYLGENCVELRKIYGEGREGWLKCMEEFLLIMPNTRGILAKEFSDGKTATELLAKESYIAHADGAAKPLHPAARYTREVGFDGASGIEKGDFFLMSAYDAADFFSRITYGLKDIKRSTGDRVNQSLNAIGGSSISVAGSAWTSSLCGSSGAWCMGNRGCAGNGNVYYLLFVVPVSLYPWR